MLTSHPSFRPQQSRCQAASMSQDPDMITTVAFDHPAEPRVWPHDRASQYLSSTGAALRTHARGSHFRRHFGRCAHVSKVVARAARPEIRT